MAGVVSNCCRLSSEDTPASQPSVCISSLLPSARECVSRSPVIWSLHLQGPFIFGPPLLPSTGGYLPFVIFKLSSLTGSADNRLPCFLPLPGSISESFSSSWYDAPLWPFPLVSLCPLSSSCGFSSLSEQTPVPPLWPAPLSVHGMSRSPSDSAYSPFTPNPEARPAPSRCPLTWA